MDSTRAKASWYWNRLRRMSLAEVSHRVGRGLQSGIQRFGLGTTRSTPPPTLVETASWLHRITPASPEPYLSQAERILDGYVSILSLDDVFVGAVPSWNRNPSDGKEVPLAFGKAIDYRDQSLVGDIKYLWVLNRHGHLVTLAQAYSLTRDERYLHGIRAHLGSWMAQCPYPRGPNWTSASELAMRLIHWSAVWQLVGGASSVLFRAGGGPGFRQEWLECIYRHAHFIQGSFSRFSSANNHLIGEACGLFVATVTWPFWEDFGAWRERAREELIREMELQNTADGVHREQSVFYQRFVLEYGIVAGLAGRACGVELPRSYWDRLESMLVFLSSVMDVGGNVPMIGDSDNTSVLTLSQEPGGSSYRSILALGAILFGRPAFKAKARAIDDGVAWMLGDTARGRFSVIDETSEPLPVRREFADGGYFVLGSDFETDREVRLIADAGPLGYLSIAAHGHADALSFTLSVAGREALIDPGTYAYQANREWRDYFRGTSAHNTIRVDGENQSVIGGNLLWTTHASVRRELWETAADRDRLVASHDGYTRLSDPVIHRRELRYAKLRRALTVRDTVTCRASHRVEMFWHFSEACSVVSEGASVIAQNGPARVVLTPPRNLGQVVLYRGSESPKAGWVSRDFGVKTPSSTVVWSCHIDETLDVTTDIAIDPL